jgi:hypothetical protein
MVLTFEEEKLLFLCRFPEVGETFLKHLKYSPQTRLSSSKPRNADSQESTVVDRNCFDADPDPTFYFDAGPDPDPSERVYYKTATRILWIFKPSLETCIQSATRWAIFKYDFAKII